MLLNQLLRKAKNLKSQLLNRKPVSSDERPAWGFEWGKYYLPNYFASARPADYHGQLFDELSDLHIRRDSKTAIIAPREGAKSTVVTLAYVIRCAVEKLEQFMLILSDSAGQAIEKLSDIRRELESNDRLAAHFPNACGIGPTWRGDRIELKNGVVIQAIGRRGRIRGRRNREVRPSLIVFDDVENNSSITSEAERLATWRWATREVIPAGSAGTNFLSVGSALHPQCVALRLGQLAGWGSRSHKAIHQWPERMDLWDDWEQLATNLADDDRAANAMKFYLARAGEMGKGAVTYWPDRWSLYDLMKRRAEIGSQAFNTEYQAIPGTAEGAEWPPEFFDRPGFLFEHWPSDLVLRIQTLDPSKGQSDKSDYQAHIMAGLAKDGTIYVDADLRKETDYVTRMIDIAAVWKPNRVVAESNNTMGLIVPELRRQLEERRKADRPVLLNYDEVIHTTPKLARIRGLTGYLSRGQIRVRNSPMGRMLVDQMRDIPNGANDDGPDALATAVRQLELLTLGR